MSKNDDLEEILQSGYRYALALTHDSQMAQDLLQQACLSISRRQGPWNIRYLITTIRNAHIDHIRRAQKLRFYPLDEELEFVGDVDMMLSSFDPQLESALARLPEDTRELLYLSVVEEFTASELANLTERPRGTILSILHRAKKQLRGLLSQDVIDGRD
ncbi:MAG: RNA polymerase sigma factor [Chloroflexota bacterium]